jgi:DNA-binding transcriptional LysR family regulator
MDRFSQMQVFVRVAELSSFTQAASSLGLPKASVSGAVQGLEKQLGTRLLHRTTRTVNLTQDGLVYYQRCKDLLGELDELESLFQQSSASISGLIRVDMPIGIAKNCVIPCLPDFIRNHPQIEVQLSSTDRRVDLVHDGFDCVVRVGHLKDSELIARPAGKLKVINCVSPAYIAQYGQPHSLDDLSGHKLIHYVLNLGAPSSGWEYFDGKNYQSINMQGAITVNNSESYTAACLAGLGIIQSPQVGVQEFLDSGELVAILQNFQAEPMTVSVIYPNRRNLPKRVQLFMDWLTAILLNYTA